MLHSYRLNARHGVKFHWLLPGLAGLCLGAAPPLPSGPPAARRLAKVASGDFGVHLDPTLTKVARDVAHAVIRDFRSAEPARVKAALRREGLADAQILPFTAVGPAWDALLARAEAFARDEARPRGPTHLGLGVASGPEGLALVLVFSRRPVALAPLPARLPSGGLTVRGRARDPAGLHALWLGPCGVDCPSLPQRLPVAAGPDGAIRVALPPAPEAGRYLFQLLGPGPRGPEVVAAWTFARGRSGAAWPPPAPVAPSEDAAGARALVDAARAHADLAPLTPDPALERAAQAHAEAMCRAKVTGHQLPGGAAPDARARAAGYPGAVRENVARAASVGQAHQNLLLSPSHRESLLEPTAQVLGVGVATAPGAEGLTESRCVVQLFGADAPRAQR